MNGAISWCTDTKNWQAGCRPKSPGCKRCYAESMSRRLQAMVESGVASAPMRYQDVVNAAGRWTGRINFDQRALENAWVAIRNSLDGRFFCGSMTDLFDPDAPLQALESLAEEMNRPTRRPITARVIFLTKEPKRLLAFQRAYFPNGFPSWLEVGITVESQTWLARRWDAFAQVRASHKFLSMEPLQEGFHLAPEVLAELDLVIVGGESVHGGELPVVIRPEWVTEIELACDAAGVGFHFKQWGSAVPVSQAPRELNAPTLWIDEQGDVGIPDGPGCLLYYMPIRAEQAGRLLHGRERLDLGRRR